MIRRFTSVRGFGDSTDYIEVDTATGKSTLVFKSGKRSTYSGGQWTLAACLRNVASGDWKEVQDTTNPDLAWVKIPGIKPNEPNALRLMSEDDLDKLERRIEIARNKIVQQRKDAAANTFTVGTRVRFVGPLDGAEGVVVKSRDESRQVSLLITKVGDSRYNLTKGVVEREYPQYLSIIAD